MAQFRREVSNHSPVVSVRGNMYSDPKESIVKMRGALPETVRDKVTITMVTYPYKPTDDIVERYEHFLDTADEYGAECSYSCAGWDSNILGNEGLCCPPELIDRYLSEHPSLKFVEICEHSCCGGMTQARKDYVCDLLEICHRHGAYFVWKDMGWKFMPNPFSEVGADNRVFDAIKKYGSNLILVNKHNGVAKFYLNHSLCLGYWLSDLIGNWGVNAEFFLNFESGMHELFKKPVGWRHKHSPLEHWNSSCPRSCYSMPSVGFLQQYMPAVSSGAVFYSLEDMHALVLGERQSAIYTKCMLPFFERLIYDDIIPSKEEVRAKVKAAYHMTNINAPEVSGWGSELYRGICASDTPDSAYDENEAMFEWLPRSGRYYFIPVLPTLAEDSKEKFKTVFDSESYKDIADIFDKRAYLDKAFGFDAAEGGHPDINGDVWGVNISDKWYMMNPEENTDVSKSFAFDLKNRNISVRGDLDFACTAIIDDEKEKTSVMLSNLIIASDRFWNGTSEEKTSYDHEKIRDYIFSSPDLSYRRKTVLHLKGDVSKVSVRGENAEYTVVVGEGCADIEINYNGIVYIEF